MRYEDFVLRQLKRNARVYSVCMKVFLAFMILFALALIGCLVSRIGIEITVFDVILMLFIAVEYPTFKRLEDYTDRTKKIRSKIEQEPKKLMISGVLIGVLALTCFGGSGMLIWVCSFSGFEAFNAWYAISIGLFGMIGIILVVLMILYLRDYGAAKKLQQYK